MNKKKTLTTKPIKKLNKQCPNEKKPQTTNQKPISKMKGQTIIRHANKTITVK